MAIFALVTGILLIVVTLWEGFETIVLPRRVTRRFRLTRLFYRITWRPWAKMVACCVPADSRETWLSVFGPLSLLLLLSLWAAVLITGFALVHWFLGSAVLVHDSTTGFLVDLYMSGTTFFTLGLGDVVPRSTAARFLMVIESGLGFAFLALVISYLPALNQAFSRREISVSLLDARAGSPPTATEMLRRHGYQGGKEELQHLLHQWERWAAEFLEGHLSYPVLAYFRSQHDNQSWLGALTAILDTSALLMSCVDGGCDRQARLTFAMARHALVDLSLVFKTRPVEIKHDRLPAGKVTALRETLEAAGVKLHEPGEPDVKLAKLRRQYEPYILALGTYFCIAVPPWMQEEHRVDNWQVSTWDPSGTSCRSSEEGTKGRHF